MAAERRITSPEDLGRALAHLTVCSKCRHEFDGLDADNIEVSNESTSDGSWVIVLICPKCGHREQFWTEEYPEGALFG